MADIKRILFLFGSRACSRSFEEHRILDSLQRSLGRDFKIYCGLRSHAKYPSRTPVISSAEISILTMSGSAKSWTRHQIWVQLAMARRIKASNSYREKIILLFFGNLRRRAHQNFVFYLLYVLRNLFRPRNLPMYLALVPLIGALLEAFFWRIIPKNPHLQALIEQIKPDVVIVVSNGQEPLLAEVQRIDSVKNRWVFLPDNWDNLFSKSVLKDFPAQFWVWGEQQRLHVKQLYPSSTAQIVEIGSSRLVEVKQKSQLNVASPKTLENGFDLLFAGKETPHDELADLEWLAMSISELALRNNMKVRIFYRPHPTAKPRSFNSKKWHQVVSNLSNCGGTLEFHTSVQESDFNPNHNRQLASQLCSFDAVIAEPTTLILESVGVGKPTAVILRDDLLHQTNSLRVWNNFDYFRRLEELEGFFVIKSKEDIESFVSNFNQTRSGINYLSLEYFVGPLDGSYVSRLGQAIRSFIGNN